MVRGSNQKNMSSNNEDCSSDRRSGDRGSSDKRSGDGEHDEYGEYYECEVDNRYDWNCNGQVDDFEDNRFGDNTYEEEKLPDKYDKYDKYDSDEFVESQLKLQDPDTMEFIRPPRIMPSIKKMNSLWDAFIQGERIREMKAWAVSVLTNWWILMADKRAEIAKRNLVIAKLKLARDQSAELGEWLKAKRNFNPITTVSALRPFDEMFDEMRKSKKEIDDKICSVDAEKRAVVVKSQLNKAFFINTEKRNIKKLGMNKNTEWHKARLSGSVVFSEKNNGPCRSFIDKDSGDDAGTGRRSQRKLRKEKELAADLILNARIAVAALSAPVVEEKEDFFPPVEEIVTEQQQEQQEIDNAQIALIKIACISKIEREEKEDIITAQNAVQDKKDLADESEFVSVMAGNLGLETKMPEQKKKVKASKISKKSTTIIVGNGLLEQAFERRGETDQKYKTRCDAFGDLADTVKLDVVLKFTKLCRSVRLGKKCFHKECRFAHSIDQLVSKECRFGQTCRYVKTDGDGSYKNRASGSSGKTCDCVHPGETDQSFSSRMGLKQVTQPVIKSSVVYAPIKQLEPIQSGSWAYVVNKAETLVTSSLVEETKTETVVDLAVETKTEAPVKAVWADVVMKSLSTEEKSAMYGKGVQMLGKIDKIENAPIVEVEARRPRDTRGLGFTAKQSFQGDVLARGFSWVKGGVLLPPKKERVQRFDTKPLYILAIEEINRRISTEEADIAQRVLVAKEKATEINKRLSNADIAHRVLLARTKASDINDRLNKPKVLVKTQETVFRIPLEHAETALISAIKSGVLDFRIEIIDDKTKYNTDSDDSSHSSHSTRSSNSSHSFHSDYSSHSDDADYSSEDSWSDSDLDTKTVKRFTVVNTNRYL